MGWGAMIGLGSGLQQVGGMLMENNKQKLADKLEKDKEARAEARADKVYARDQASFDHTAVEQNPEGVWMQVDYAKSGDKLDSRLAPANVIAEMNTKQQADKVSLENAILSGKKTQAELDYLPEKQDLDRRDTESQIAYRKTQGLASTMRASGTGTGAEGPASSMEVAGAITKRFSDLTQQARSVGILQGDIDKMAEAAAREGRSLEDAQRRFRDSLNILVRNAKQDAE